MTDFTFTRFMRSAQEGSLPERNRDAWFAGVCSSNWITWQLSAITGIVGASYVPTRVGSRVHRHAGAGGAGRTQPQRAARGRRARSSLRSSRCWRSRCRSSSACSAAPSRESPPRRWPIPGSSANRRARWRTRERSRSPASALGVVIVGLALSTFVTRTSFLLAGARFRLGSPRRGRAALRAGVHAGRHHRARHPDASARGDDRFVGVQSAPHRRVGRGIVAVLVAQYHRMPGVRDGRVLARETVSMTRCACPS